MYSGDGVRLQPVTVLVFVLLLVLVFVLLLLVLCSCSCTVTHLSVAKNAATAVMPMVATTMRENATIRVMTKERRYGSSHRGNGCTVLS